jgi:hypothetical protein
LHLLCLLFLEEQAIFKVVANYCFGGLLMSTVQRSPDEFVTPPKLAKEATVSVEKIIGWLLAGELRGYNFAGQKAKRPRYRIRRSDWEDFLERRRAAVTPSSPRPRRSRPKHVPSYV